MGGAPIPKWYPSVFEPWPYSNLLYIVREDGVFGMLSKIRPSGVADCLRSAVTKLSGRWSL